MRSPLRYTRPYRPRFEGKNLRPRFFRTMEERFLRRPNFALRYQRHHTGQWSSLKLSRKTRASSPPNQQFDKGLNKNSPTAHTKPSSTDIPRLSSGDRSSLSFTVSQNSSNRDALSSVTCAGARSRAIQKKQEQIEEVYRQDCDTFGMVVKMLVAKDPSLAKPIQLSLRENLRDIGLRCIKAMEQFIHEYDSQELDTPATSQLHSIK
ncbi:periphilin-1-like isoform X1 [Labeo rohita]|uniref:Periphilin-1-like isoform X1 n=3 Tax=Labeo rohita TaxID=84645 RepID=A0A498M5Y2_LABRO|nr:Periphilin-1 [Labeo rohita]RXN12607.1 periphilin-1-like isoform X1 [Labeo rohita]